MAKRFVTVTFETDNTELSPEEVYKALEKIGIPNPKVNIFSTDDTPGAGRPRWVAFPPPEYTGEF